MPTPKRPNSSLTSRPLEDIIAPLTAILGDATSSSIRNSPRLLPVKLEGEELILSLYEARAEEVPAHLPQKIRSKFKTARKSSLALEEEWKWVFAASDEVEEGATKDRLKRQLDTMVLFRRACENVCKEVIRRLQGGSA
jgi:hypothetical protein